MGAGEGAGFGGLEVGGAGGAGLFFIFGVDFFDEAFDEPAAFEDWEWICVVIGEAHVVDEIKNFIE